MSWGDYWDDHILSAVESDGKSKQESINGNDEGKNMEEKRGGGWQSSSVFMEQKRRGGGS